MKLLAVLALVIGLAACSSDGGGAGDSSAADVAANVKAEIDSVTKIVEITEDNDPNETIGRPGSYVEAVSIYDERAECDSELDVTCGAKIELFESASAAKDRRDYIQKIVEGSSGLISEYDYLDGKMLLRVSDQLKPSEAEEYEAAFSD